MDGKFRGCSPPTKGRRSVANNMRGTRNGRLAEGQSGLWQSHQPVSLVDKSTVVVPQRPTQGIDHRRYPIDPLAGAFLVGLDVPGRVLPYRNVRGVPTQHRLATMPKRPRDRQTFQLRRGSGQAEVFPAHAGMNRIPPTSLRNGPRASGGGEANPKACPGDRHDLVIEKKVHQRDVPDTADLSGSQSLRTISIPVSESGGKPVPFGLPSRDRAVCCEGPPRQ